MRFLVIVITLMLTSTLLHARRGYGDPDKGGSAPLEETEQYIKSMLTDSASFNDGMNRVSVHIAFNRTQVTLLIELFDLRDSNKEINKQLYSFDLKDLNPDEVGYSSKRLTLAATDDRPRFQVADTAFLASGAILGPRVTMQDRLYIEVNPTSEHFEHRLANAFAHAIKVSGGQTEEPNDPFK